MFWPCFRTLNLWINEFVAPFFDVTNRLLDDTFNLVFKKFRKNLVASLMDGYFPGVFEEFLPHEHRPFIIFINNFKKTFMNSIWSQNKLFPRFIYFFATFYIVVVQLSKNLFTKMRKSQKHLLHGWISKYTEDSKLKQYPGKIVFGLNSS